MLFLKNNSNINLLLLNINLSFELLILLNLIKAYGKKIYTWAWKMPANNEKNEKKFVMLFLRHSPTLQTWGYC